MNSIPKLKRPKRAADSDSSFSLGTPTKRQKTAPSHTTPLNTTIIKQEEEVSESEWEDLHHFTVSLDCAYVNLSKNELSKNISMCDLLQKTLKEGRLAADGGVLSLSVDGDPALTQYDVSVVPACGTQVFMQVE